INRHDLHSTNLFFAKILNPEDLKQARSTKKFPVKILLVADEANYLVSQIFLMKNILTTTLLLICFHSWSQEKTPAFNLTAGPAFSTTPTYHISGTDTTLKNS